MSRGTNDTNGGSGADAGLRAGATGIVNALIDAGHEAYFAGGCVRDRLLGIEPEDYDVATSGTPSDILRVFPRAQGVGQSFGVMLVRSAGRMYEVATFRADGGYSDGRHPDRVTFSDARHDAERRDFTINGLFENPVTGEIIDFVGGRRDIEARVIRAIGEAEARLREDQLRMLRAVRFAARFAFELEESTADAIRRGTDQLRGVSRERVGQEVKRMMVHPNRAVAAWTIQYLGLDEQVLLEAHHAAAPTRLSRLADDAPYPTALAAWMLDRKGGSAVDDQQRARQWGRSLVLSNAELEAVERCIHVHQVLKSSWPELGVARQKRLVATSEFEQALAVLLTENRSAFIQVRRQVADLIRTGLQPPPLINGNDLAGMGLAAGPTFGRVLEAVYDAQLEGTVADREQAMRLARYLIETRLSE